MLCYALHLTQHGVGSKEVLECAKTMVGRIIGKGGETIKELQKRFSTSIQIEQSTTPCRVTITGTVPHMVMATRRAIEDLLGPGPAGGHSAPPPYAGEAPRDTREADGRWAASDIVVMS